MSTAEVTDFARLKTIFHETTNSDVDIKEVTENSQEDSCMGQIATILTSENPQTVTPSPSSLNTHSKPLIPRLPLPGPTSKSHDSSKSLGTVIHHDSTPQSRSKTTPFHLSRPQSTTFNVRSPSTLTQSTRDEVDEIASLTSQDALKSLYSLLSSKLSVMQENQLSPKDRQDIQTFFQTQKKSFRMSLRSNLGSRPLVLSTQTPYELSKRDKVRQSNHEKDRKREAIQEQHFEAELIRLKAQRRMAKKQAIEQRDHLVTSLARKYRSMILREEAQLHKEKKVRSNSDKQVIVENIKNFYKDRIEMLKEHIDDQKLDLKSAARDQRLAKAMMNRQKNQAKAAQLDAIHSALEREKTMADMELKEIEAQLVAMYKRA